MTCYRLRRQDVREDGPVDKPTVTWWHGRGAIATEKGHFLVCPCAEPPRHPGPCFRLKANACSEIVRADTESDRAAGGLALRPWP